MVFLYLGLNAVCYTGSTPTNWKARRLCQNDCNLGAIDDCVRPNGFVGGTPLPKIVLMMAFTTVALLIPEPWSGLTDTPGLFLSGHQPACHS